MADIYTRTVNEDTPHPVPGKLTGAIPTWIKGSLLRNGPGMKKIGNMEMSHLFDGLSLIHQFNISDGNATYKSRFLQSQSYKHDTAANMIVMTEFGTQGVPDPCQNIFKRYFSYFFPQITDNCNINLIPYGGNAIYAVTETPYIHKIDPVTLHTLERIDLSKYINVQTATAHAHVSQDGCVYNIGTCRDRNGMKYYFLKFPKIQNDEKLTTFEQVQIIGTLASTTGSMNYFHSFGITENYFVFMEQPLVFNLKILLMNMLLKQGPLTTALEWKPNEQVKIHLINRNTGERYSVGYVAHTSFTFHHINAYEDNGFVVMDVCCYEDVTIINTLTLENLRKENPFDNTKLSYAKRFVLPLDISSAKVGVNLVDLDYTEAKAVLQENGSVYLTPDLLSKTSIELPVINYGLFNGRKYQYAYGVIFVTEPVYQTKLIKLDVINKTEKEFYYPGNYPSEPIFVARPGATDEDDGVVLSSVVCKDPTLVYLSILDGKSFKEIARVEFKAEACLDFHGIFISAEEELLHEKDKATENNSE